MRAAVLLALLCLAVATAADVPPSPSRLALAPSSSAATPEQAMAERQLLLMLRAPPPHFRPDADYAGDYQTAPGRHARRRIARELAREHGLRLRDDWPMPALGLDCFVLEAVSGDARTRIVPRLAADPRVESVQPMQLFRLRGAGRLGAGDPLSAAQPAVARWHLRQLHTLATGRRVVVAALDTGVDVHHPDLHGQVAVTRDFVDGGATPAETHGTQVAGIIGARSDDGIGIAGVAPQARLLALRACWQSPGADGAAACSSFTLAKALQFALDADAQVLNLSLTGADDRLLARLLDAALQRGVTVVAAVDVDVDDGGFPAAHPGVLAVAGVHDHGARPGVLLAPDRGIPAPTPGGGWTLVSGPSYAAAQVSGLVALLRELSPRLRATQLRAALAPAPGLGLASRRPTLIDACAAVVRVAQRCACDCVAAPTASARPRR
ncbi:S8 family serine peptidase [Lysobacter cavernae]|uniref:S8 family serine peptidase n=1 Tax=Lysobacter cavernae TaxID=1685901 RepID=A0ABV7RLP7_9GAMM